MKLNRPSALLVALLVLGTALPAQGQYKWLDPEGRVVYGDRPPSAEAQRVGASGSRTAPTAPGSEAPAPAPAAAPAGRPALSAALKTATSRYPVILYTGRNCDPCGSARTLLNGRGIPFTEKTIASEADLAAFRSLGFKEMTVPALTVGRERQSGFETDLWNRLLDAGGYPKTTQLPRDYRGPMPAPLASDTAANETTLAASGASGTPGGRVVENLIRTDRPTGAAALQAPPLMTSPGSSIRF